MSEEAVPYNTHGNPEIKVINETPKEPDVSADTEKVKEVYGLMKKVQEAYNSMTVEEQTRMSELSEYFFGE
jgi:hypothetical protein